jgi:hypothetical protein
MLGPRFRYLEKDILEYEKNGITPILRDYASEIAEFISAKTVPQTGNRMNSEALYSAYEEYCREKNLVPETKNMLGRQLKDLGYINCRDKTGMKAWRDITLAEADHE